MSFAGVAPVLQLPFGRSPEQLVLHSALVRLIERLVALGVDGLVILGLASEAWTLTEAERDAVCGTVAEAIGERVPLIAGVEGATAIACARARKAVGLGASGLMVLPPPRPSSPEQVAAHFVQVADAAGVPILIQDSPQVTGVEMSAQFLVDLSTAHPLLRSVKIEAPAAGAKASRVATAGLEVVAGWGGLHYLESLRRGAVGCMPGSDLGPAFAEIHRLVATGSRPAAEELYRQILPLLSYAAQSLDLLILSAKRALVRWGIFPSGALRQPARELDDEEAQTLDALFERLEQAGVPGWSFVPPCSASRSGEEGH